MIIGPIPIFVMDLQDFNFIIIASFTFFTPHLEEAYFE
jgi:hypothetical protein